MNFIEIELDKALEYTQPTKYIVDSTDYDDDFETPVLTAGKNFLLGYTDEIEGVFKNVPAIIFDDFTTSFHYVDFPFKVKSSALKILNARNEQFDIKYIYYLMKGVKIDTELHKRYWISRFSKKTIPLPTDKSNIRNPKSEIENISLSTQKRIAEILDNAAALRDNTKQLLTEYDQLAQSIFLDMFGDPVTNPKGWEISKFKDVLEIRNGKNQKKVLNPKGKYPIYGSGGIMDYADNFISNKNSVIIGRKGSINNPILVREKFWHVDTAFGLNPIREKLDYNYLYYFCIRYNFEQHNKTVTIPSLTKSTLYEIKIPIPPIDLQNQFAEKMALIEQQKDLAKQELQESEDLFQALLQKAFKGELN